MFEGVVAYNNPRDDPLETDTTAYQCVEYIRRFYALRMGYGSAVVCKADAGNDPWVGDAWEYSDQQEVERRELIYEPTDGPRPGDIIAWPKSNSNSYGHVALVKRVSRDLAGQIKGIVLIEQNYYKSTNELRLIPRELNVYKEGVSWRIEGGPVWSRSTKLDCELLGEIYNASQDGSTVLFGEAEDLPIVGDWDGNQDGNARDTIGVYRFTNCSFYLDNNNDGTRDGEPIQLGHPGDIPISGDWNGDDRDTIGVFRQPMVGTDTGQVGPASGTFYLGDNNGTITSPYTKIGDLPIVGNWDADPEDEIGVFRSYDEGTRSTRFLFDYDRDGSFDDYLEWGMPGDLPLVGDWDGDGVDSIGVYRPCNGVFYLRESTDTNSSTHVDQVLLSYGETHEIPLVGDWDGDGRDGLGVFRPQDWQRSPQVTTFSLTNDTGILADSSASLSLRIIPLGKSTFEKGDTQEKWVSVIAGQYQGRTVKTYVTVAKPDTQGGTQILYAYYPSSSFNPSDALHFSSAKTPLYPGTWNLQNSDWHWDTYVFDGSEPTGTWTWEFWYEDAATGGELLHDEKSYYVSQKLSIVDQAITPSTAAPKDEITFRYTINNPASYALEMGSVRLGAQIRKSNPVGEWIDHYDGDRSPPINSGVHEYSRPFQIPPNNNYLHSPEPGLYDVRWVLVDNSTGEWIDEKVVDAALTIVVDFPPVEPSYGSVSGKILYGGTETGLSGVNITLSGAASRSTSTDANGNYTFTGLTGGTYTITPSKAGYAFQPPYRIVTIVSDSGASSTAKAATGIAFVGTATTNCQPEPPANLTTSVQSARRIDLTWNDVGNETEYVIYRSSAGGSYVPIDVVGENTTAYQNVGLSANTEHCYKIKAQNSCGSSSFSNESCGTTLPDASSDPFILLSSTYFGISAIEGGANPSPRTLTITNGGGGTLNWSANWTQPWLDLSASSGTSPSNITVSVDISGLSPGAYSDTIAITVADALNTPQIVEVELSVTPSGYYGLAWTYKGDSPERDANAASAVLFNKIYLFGFGSFLTSYSYDPSTDSWTQIADLPSGQGVSEGGAAVVGNRFYVISSAMLPHGPAVRIYDPVADSWSYGEDLPLPHPRRGVAVAAVNGKLYAIGGEDIGDNALSNTDEYDPTTDTWTAKASMPTPRGYAAVAVLNGLIYVIGGQDNAAGSPTQKAVEIYNTTNDSWSTVEPLPSTSRTGAIAGVINGKIYLAGGRKDNDYCDTVYKYDPAADMWTLEDNHLLAPRAYAAGGVVNDKFYVIGGWDNVGSVSPLSSVEEGSLVVVNASPNVPCDPNPAQLAEDVSVNANLGWQGGDPDPGDTVTYNVYFGAVTNDPPLVSQGQSPTTYDPGVLAYSTKYSWKVVARDNHGKSTRSDVFFFATEQCAPPEEPTLNDPGTCSASGDYTVDWSSVSTVTSYSLEEDDNASFSSPDSVYTGSNLSTSFSAKGDGVYYYRVKAISCAEGNWSSTEDIIVDTVPPTGGAIINDDEESTASLIVTLTLNAGDQEGSGVAQMRLSNDSSTWTSWESFAGTKSNWDLSTVGGNANVGVKALYVRYKDEAGNESPPYTDNIDYNPTSEGAVFRVTSEGDVRADGAFYGQTFLSGAADVAEWVPVSEPVEPGDVLELDPDNPGQYRRSSSMRSTLVAGVVSAEPGVVLGTVKDVEGKALLALLGIVPVKVTDEGGPIQPGDLLVTSSTAGHAMRWDPDVGSPCDLVGKALEPLTEESGIILVLLTAH